MDNRQSAQFVELQTGNVEHIARGDHFGRTVFVIALGTADDVIPLAVLPLRLNVVGMQPFQANRPVGITSANDSRISVAVHQGMADNHFDPDVRSELADAAPQQSIGGMVFGLLPSVAGCAVHFEWHSSHIAGDQRQRLPNRCDGQRRSCVDYFARMRFGTATKDQRFDGRVGIGFQNFAFAVSQKCVGECSNHSLVRSEMIA